MKKTIPCKCCGLPVAHGEDGVIYGPPPWDPEAGEIAECYDCLVKAELEGIEEERTEALVQAEMSCHEVD